VKNKIRKYAKDKRKLIILSRNFTFSCCYSELPLYAHHAYRKIVFGERERKEVGGGENLFFSLSNLSMFSIKKTNFYLTNESKNNFKKKERKYGGKERNF
jgi:hypothetical protein